MSVEHRNIPSHGVHVPHAFKTADLNTLVVTALDIDKLALLTTDNTYHKLTSVEPAVWTKMTLSTADIKAVTHSDATILKDADIGSTVQGYDANTTLQGNTFNGVSQLVKLDGTGKLPAIDGSQLTNMPVALPSQTGFAGKYLRTDGTIASWEEVASAGSAAPINNNIKKAMLLHEILYHE